MRTYFEIDRESKVILFYFNEGDIKDLAGLVVNENIPRKRISETIAGILTKAMQEVSEIINEDLSKYEILTGVIS